MEKLKDMAASLAVDYLLPPLKKAVKSVMEIPKDVADMEDKLDKIQAMIHAADKMAATEEVNSSRDEMKAKVKHMVETSFRMEDIIDEYTINQERQLRDDPGCEAIPCKALDFFKTKASRLHFAYMNEDVKSEFGGIKEKNKSEDASQGESSGGNQNITFDNLRMAPLFLKESEVVGFDGPRAKLEKWLIKGEKARTVISVVGMGGVGKTTLAKKVFDKVKTHFTLHEWITVSQSYTIEGLLREMLLKLEPVKLKPEEKPEDCYSTMNKRSLIDKVREHLRLKRYVIVFDDVWNENFWDEMEFALIDDENGSKIIITTRYLEVAESCRTSSVVQVQELKPLTDDKSFELFCKKAFGSNLDGQCPNNLKFISTEIVKKCEGLPLAIVAIGGLLSRKSRDAREWQRFSENLISELGKHPKLTPVTKILGFSYYDLPYNLKPCLLYFGIYPENCEIERRSLILQWIAEGFVKSKMTNTVEEIAEQYLNELIQRSLVQVSSFTKSDKVKSCRVHDLVREMIHGKIEDLCFCHFAGRYENLSKSGTIRGLTITSDFDNLLESIENSNIRSLHVFRDEALSESLEKSMPTKYTFLRVLHLEGDSLYDYIPLSEIFGDLSLLRYLSLRRSNIDNLPKSIGVLHNLETLDLRETAVHMMPREIYKLKKLRHILSYGNYFNEGLQMEGGIGDLTSLQTLRDVDAKHNTEEVMKWLETLTQLRVLGFVHVWSGFKDFLCSLINKMQHLEKLYIVAENSNIAIDLQFDVFAPMLQKVHIIGQLEEFPKWVAKLQNLVTLSLSGSRLTDDDPLSLLKDLPNLSSLYLFRYAHKIEVLQFPNKGFQNLKQIVLRQLFDLKFIVIEDGALPSLEKFTLESIIRLTEVPSGLYNLPKLQVFHVIEASDEFKENFHLNRGERPWIIE